MNYLYFSAIIIFAMILPTTAVNAAYWIIDNQVSAKSHFGTLTEEEKILLGGARYYEVDDSIFKARDSKVCSSKYKKFANLLREETGDEGIEKIVLLQEKNIKVCLKKDKSLSVATTSSMVNEDLMKRIQYLELQIKKILAALQTLGIRTQ